MRDDESLNLGGTVGSSGQKRFDRIWLQIKRPERKSYAVFFSSSFLALGQM